MNLALIAAKAFLTKYWKQSLIALLLVGAFSYVYFLHSSNERKEQTIALMRTEAALQQEKQDLLEVALYRQSQAIEKLAVATDKSNEVFRTLDKRIANQFGSLTERLTNINKEPIPQTCEEAIDYLRRAEFK